jgi:hypothetical protein
MDCVATFLLVWNPDSWPWPDSDYESTVAATDAGRATPGRWSVGRRRHGIVRGDRAYLVRQHRDRGLVGGGEFTSEIYEDEHWNQSGRNTTYADLSWELLLPAEDRIPIEVLKAEVPGVSWDRLQGSGVLVSDEAARQLERLWGTYASASIFRSPETGGTPLLDVAIRQPIAQIPPHGYRDHLTREPKAKQTPRPRQQKSPHQFRANPRSSTQQCPPSSPRTLPTLLALIGSSRPLLANSHPSTRLQSPCHPEPCPRSRRRLRSAAISLMRSGCSGIRRWCPRSPFTSSSPPLMSRMCTRAISEPRSRA